MNCIALLPSSLNSCFTIYEKDLFPQIEQGKSRLDYLWVWKIGEAKSEKYMVSEKNTLFLVELTYTSE